MNIEGDKPVWLWNGRPVPLPNSGLKFLTSQLVTDERNANGQVIADTINRRQVKMDSVTWNYLSASDWEWILEQVKGFKVNVTYYEPMERRIINRLFYFGDSSATPFEWDSKNHSVAKPLSYIQCSVNIIDMGY